MRCDSCFACGSGCSIDPSTGILYPVEPDQAGDGSVPSGLRKLVPGKSGISDSERLSVKTMKNIYTLVLICTGIQCFGAEPFQHSAGRQSSQSGGHPAGREHGKYHPGGSHHTAEVQQQGGNTAEVQQGGNDNTAKVTQDGENNTADISQQGSSHSAYIRQAGYGFTANQQQEGFGNRAYALQHHTIAAARESSITQEQNGSNNYAAAVQLFSSGNSITQTQGANSQLNKAVTLQAGSGNTKHYPEREQQ